MNHSPPPEGIRWRAFPEMKAAATTLALCVAALLTLGLVMLYSSSMADKDTHILRNQLIWLGIGMAGMMAAACADYRLLKKAALPLLGFSLLLLALVFVPRIGLKINGAHRWIRIHGKTNFQPSELAKLALIIAVAWYGDRNLRKLGTVTRGLFFPGLLIGCVLGFIFVEPDRGTTIMMAAVTGMMLFIIGARWKFIVPPAICGAAALTFSIMRDPMRRGRVLAWFLQNKRVMDAGYQSHQGTVALGAGGLFGLGLGNSREKLGFLPEHNTDFIFAIIGEELGLIGTMLVLLGFVLLVVCGWKIATGACDTFGFMLASGITFLIGLQAFINIGVVTNLLPNKGLPLPFISYGGSNLLFMMISVGLLFSVARRANVLQSVGGVALDRETTFVPQTT
jgi:cell division protein FtsW